MSDYEQHHYDKDVLTQRGEIHTCNLARVVKTTISQLAATTLGSIDVSPSADLEQVRQMIVKLQENSEPAARLSADWCFVDCKCKSFLTGNILILYKSGIGKVVNLDSQKS